MRILRDRWRIAVVSALALLTLLVYAPSNLRAAAGDEECAKCSCVESFGYCKEGT
jgi:hypothetical protein